jgi:hypothetical protein
MLPLHVRCRRWVRKLSRAGFLARLEELDRIPGAVLEYDLLSALARDDLVPEREPRLLQLGYAGCEIRQVETWSLSQNES